MPDVIYLIVAVEGVEDELGATAAIENLSNNEQSFTVTESRAYDSTELEQVGEPILYIP